MYVIGTAGHVDHGKSTLVKALTGIDPDRWAEEQRREMTIDLGFAWLTLPSGRAISLIDVPGHERFIKNMLAGVGGIDAALLVVAADESIMPQTVEHLAILDLLEVSHGLVVLSKVDLVEPAWLDLVRGEVRERLASTSLADAPLLPVSARSGQGLNALVAALDSLLDGLPSRAAAQGLPRLSIDRAFTIGGFGTVVTGTLVGGPLRVGDEVELLPQGLRARVRGLQTHKTRQELALPGTRVAVNLAGVSHHDLARGDLLASPGALQPTTLLDVQVRLLADAPRPLVQNAPLELFVGAAEVPCRATLLERDTLAPGAQGWLQLRLERPVAVVRGEHYILRQPSPGRTIGGGRIVEAHPPRHRRFRREVIQALESLARGTPADLLRRPLADDLPQRWPDLLRASGLPEELARAGLAELLAQRAVVALPDLGPAPGAPPAALAEAAIVTAAGWAALQERLAAALAAYHRRFPLRLGIPREELRSRLRLSGATLDLVLDAASAAGLARMVGTSVALPDHHPAPAGEQARQIQRALAALAASPYSPPALDLAPELLAWLIEQGHAVRVSEDVCFASGAYAEMLAWVQAQLADTGSVTMAQFRDRFGSSRKYALALLEHLDERKVTRRAGDARVRY